jgi:hypothetical protein
VKAASLLLLLGGSVALGLFLGWRYLRHQRNNPVHSAVHLMLGVAGLECMVMLRRGAPDGTVVPAEGWGNAAALLLVLSVLSGLLSPMVGRHWGRRPGTVALIAHAALGAGGFILFLGWLVQA